MYNTYFDAYYVKKVNKSYQFKMLISTENKQKIINNQPNKLILVLIYHNNFLVNGSPLQYTWPVILLWKFEQT